MRAIVVVVLALMLSAPVSGAGRLPDPAKHKAACARLEQGLRDVRSKMRTGYGAKEGERLKQRQRQLNNRRRLEKCR